MKTRLLVASLVLLCLTSCGEKKEEKAAGEVAVAEADPARDSLVTAYIDVPNASDMLNAGDTGMAVFALCQQRYTEQLAALKKETDAIGAKLILTILSPETGASSNAATRKGVPFIMEAAAGLGIEAHDITTPLAKYTPQQLTQMPLDGHWSVAGSKIVADLYQPVIAANTSFHSPKTFPATERPAVLGDLDPNQDAALDGGKNIPYQLVTNSQGFRMNYPLAFPKTKQRILFIGDSQLYSPFLDNGQTFIAVLQEAFPDKELINAGVIGYTLDDYVDQLAKKAKYAEPDVVVLVTNPNDIGDFYFAQRNKMSRQKKAFRPVPVELALHQQLFKK